MQMAFAVGFLAAALVTLANVRGTGQGFCWSIARLVTGVGQVLTSILLAASGSYPAWVATIALYVVGLVAIWLSPETRDLVLRDR